MSTVPVAPKDPQGKSRAPLCRSCECQNFLVETTGKPGTVSSLGNFLLRQRARDSRAPASSGRRARGAGTPRRAGTCTGNTLPPPGFRFPCRNRPFPRSPVQPDSPNPGPGRPGEFHPESPTDPDMSLSTHPARATQRRLPPSIKTRSSSGFPLTPSLPG
jgi:hypothetical protein